MLLLVIGVLSLVKQLFPEVGNHLSSFYKNGAFAITTEMVQAQRLPWSTKIKLLSFIDLLYIRTILFCLKLGMHISVLLL